MNRKKYPLPILSRRKANAFFLASFIGLAAIILFTGNLWPGLGLAVGVSLVLRQLLRGRPYDALASLIAFVALVLSAFPWLQIFGVFAAITLLIREIFHIRQESPEEEVIELQQEIEEERHGEGK